MSDPADLSERERCVLAGFRRVRLMSAARAGEFLESAGLVVGGSPSNRCLPGSSVLRALARRGLAARGELVDGRREWLLTPEGESLCPKPTNP